MYVLQNVGLDEQGCFYIFYKKYDNTSSVQTFKLHCICGFHY